MIKIPIKAGDTFLLQGTVKIDGIVQDITDWTIESMVKMSSASFSDTLVVTITDGPNGLYTLRKDDTTTWPSGLNTAKAILCDIQYTIPSGQKISTETFEISCYTGIS